MLGMIIKGSHNIFTVRAETAVADGDDGHDYECRLKGKVLNNKSSKKNNEEKFYNPLAPGDWVEFEKSSLADGMIYNLHERQNMFTRYNRKGDSIQILGSNIDILACVTTPEAPPFRPRFIDRILLQSAASKIKPLIIVNKCELINNLLAQEKEEYKERFKNYNKLDINIIEVSALEGIGIKNLADLLRGKLSLFCGQSGVGKSSLINSLCGKNIQKTAVLNEKYNRGNHTTVLAELRTLKTHAGIINIIDTPGVRQFVPSVRYNLVSDYMSDIFFYAAQCSYGASCSHHTEDGCAVREAAAHGKLHHDRYESFLRIYDELYELKKY